LLIRRMNFVGEGREGGREGGRGRLREGRVSQSEAKRVHNCTKWQQTMSLYQSQVIRLRCYLARYEC